LLVPTGIRRLSIHGSVQGTCFVQVGESALTRQADDVLADLQIRNERGRPLLRIEGLLLKYVPRDFLDKFDGPVPAEPSLYRIGRSNAQADAKRLGFFIDSRHRVPDIVGDAAVFWQPAL